MQNNSKMKSWILASRPKTLFAAISPVLVGSALAFAYDKFSFLPALTALLCSVLIQIATNFVNDLYDFLKGADNEKRLGPTRALAAGLISAKQMKNAIILTFSLAFFLGLYLVYIAGWPILVVGIISIIAGYAYTAGPYPLAYNGLGDIFVFIFFGIIATTGTFFVQTLFINEIIFLASVPCGALITNILVVNNYRDSDTDKLTNKKTLAVIFGKSFTRIQYVVSVLVSFFIPFLFFTKYNFGFFILLPFLTFPLAIKLVKMMFYLNGTALNKTLELSAKFSFIFSLLFAIGIVGWKLNLFSL